MKRHRVPVTMRPVKTLRKLLVHRYVRRPINNNNNNRTADPREGMFLYQRISVAIQRFNAVCLTNSLTVSESPS